MEIPSKYQAQQAEKKWYQFWLDKKLFSSTPDEREPYTIVIPPPNVTGVLHMGHILNNTIQDVLIRRAKMQGKNALWVPGTDHASIATEAKVVNKLKQDGIDKNQLTRDEFLEHAWEWKEKHGGIILQQLKKLGAACDWDRTKFTMDPEMSESVINVFVDLYTKNLIYRGVRMVNWDPQAKTAVSDEEVLYKEVQSKLYHLKYKIEGQDDHVVIATTRPETILGDTAVCINPNDERYRHLKGKRVLVPLINRSIPIIWDEYVDMEFGTGCLKVTPAHDINDYELGQKHNLEAIDIFNDDGTLNEAAQLFVGKDRFLVRKEIVPELEAAGNLEKIEDYVNKVGYSERTDAVIEPKLSMQWFLKMKDIAKPALDVVMNDQVQFHPPKFKNTYRHWMENVRDWNISRQLWWGQRIPAYYLPNSNDFVVAPTPEEALQLAKQKLANPNLTIDDLRQDEDVLDTWFSSWLWPISVFDGIRNPDNEDIRYYYSTNDLVTAPEIMFFWVARMIMAGMEYRKAIPFKNVYFTGIVRDDQRRKMSKSLGNSPDPLDLIDQYGADGVRVGMLLCSPAGNDLLYDNSLPEQGRNFANKIWNAFRLVNGWKIDKSLAQPESAKYAVDWYEAKFNEVVLQITDNYNKFRLSDVIMNMYKLFWDDFSAWYLEIIKPAFGEGIDQTTFEKTIGFFDQMLRLLHPFMPFITEEIWHLIHQNKADWSIMNEKYPEPQPYNKEIVADFDDLKNIITNVRNIRQERNIPFKEQLELHKKGKSSLEKYKCVLVKACNLSEFSLANEKPEGAVSFMVKTNEFFIPLGDKLNVEEEIEKLEKELKYQEGFLKSVAQKLSNKRFVDNAPKQVVANEQKKQADAEAKISAIKQQLAELK